MSSGQGGTGVFKIYECDCVVCKAMCHAPCCGTPEEMEAIMDAGLGGRLCLDDWSGHPTDVQPALKGYEGRRAPYMVSSEDGCTFYRDGKCELHERGLKPIGGRAAYHDMVDEEYMKVEEHILKSWKTKKAKEVIKRFKGEHLKRNDISRE